MALANKAAVNANVSLDVNNANVELGTSNGISAYDEFDNSSSLYGSSLNETENSLKAGSDMNQYFQLMTNDNPANVSGCPGRDNVQAEPML